MAAFLILGILGAFQFVPFHFHASLGPMAFLHTRIHPKLLARKWVGGMEQLGKPPPDRRYRTQVSNIRQRIIATVLTTRRLGPGVQILDGTYMQSAEQTENQKPVCVSNS